MVRRILEEVGEEIVQQAELAEVLEGLELCFLDCIRRGEKWVNYMDQ